MPFWMIRIFSQYGNIGVVAAGAIVFGGAGYLFASYREGKIRFAPLDALCIAGMALLIAFIGWYVYQDSLDAFHIEESLFQNYYYVGQVAGGKATGRGLLYDKVSRNLTYNGYFKDSQRAYDGIQYYGNGDRYNGEWKNNQRHGHGIYYYATGGYYEGEWANDKQNGPGAYYYADGTPEAREYRNGERIS